ncbi:MAG: efflux RND transporter periplasmic adaptor subunit [Calditrichia bacterium]
MKRILVLFLIFSLFSLGCRKQAEQTAEKPLPVRVVEVAPDSIASFIAISGGLKAAADARLISKTTARVVRILKKAGDAVEANAVIIQLEDELQQAALHQAEAALAAAQLRTNRLEKDFQRMRRLHLENAISQQQWEQAESAYQEAIAALDQAKAMKKQAYEQLEFTRIRAPFAGIVAAVNVKVGETVVTGQAVGQVVSSKTMLAELQIPDLDLPNIKVGQTVLAVFPTFLGKQFIGKISRIDAALDPLSRTARAEVLLPNENGRLTSGMYGEFKIATEVRRNTLAVPDNALIQKTEVAVDPASGELQTVLRYFVFVAEEGIARLREVKTGLSSENRVEITEGLQPGEKVLVVGQRIVRDGQKIEVIQ